ncbi:XdhC family protein [Paeniglutamicibacter sp. ORCA_105]|uniref:XdhC family protein n=1 Tax=Paeniglutamicibacter sp. ORCA_105 TaxID=3377336 RepID=UPI00389600F2
MLNLHSALNTSMTAVGESFAVATIVDTRGSTPHPRGTSMLIHGNGRITGSLSGGCIDAAVHTAALEAMAQGTSRREHYGYSPTDPFATGLMCGGEVDVHIAPFDAGSSMHRLLETYASLPPADPVALVRRIDAGSSDSTLISDPSTLSVSGLAGLVAPLAGEDGSSQAARLCFPLIAAGRTGVIKLDQESGSCSAGAVELFVESRLAPPRMIVFGANSYAEELLKLAPALGYSSTLCDARAAFTLQPRFGVADEISTLWPHDYLAGEIAARRVDERTVLCVLTHDPKFDIPLLSLALGQPLAYVGAMGSRTSHESRMRELRAAAVPEKALATLHSPIGLDLQAATPGEVAIGIAAEIIASRSPLATGAALNTLSGPIHGGVPGNPSANAASRQPANRGAPAWT